MTVPANTKIIQGDALSELQNLPAGSADVCVTSPPYYWQRDYGYDSQIGHEPSLNDYVETLVEIFGEMRRVLSDRGLLWLNIGDSYYSGNGQPKGSDPRSPSRNWMRKKTRPLDVSGFGVPKKSALGVPWLVAHALQRDGWTIRSEIIWCRDSAFAEPSVKDRPHRKHETIFLIAKSRWYDFDRTELETDESVWNIAHERGAKGHSAAFPLMLPMRCLKCSMPKNGRVIDPFAGTGTTGVAARILGGSSVLIDASKEYCEIARNRIEATTVDLFSN